MNLEKTMMSNLLRDVRSIKSPLVMLLLIISCVGCKEYIEVPKKTRILNIQPYGMTHDSNNNSVCTNYEDTVDCSVLYDKPPKKYSSSLEDCTPCLLKQYDLNKQLRSISYSYLDCFIGRRIEFGENGNRHFECFYKEPSNPEDESIVISNYCSIKQGDMFHYMSDGTKYLNTTWENDSLTGVHYLINKDSIGLYRIYINNEPAINFKSNKNEIYKIEVKNELCEHEEIYGINVKSYVSYLDSTNKLIYSTLISKDMLMCDLKELLNVEAKEVEGNLFYITISFKEYLFGELINRSKYSYKFDK